MRLARIDLLAYGPFRGQSLDFSRPGLHVVLGRNEAGKSTTLRAITGLLYGIRATTDAHLHKPSDLRIGGVLENGTGERVRVVRRRGNANTLLDESGQPLDDAILRRLLGGVSEETFRTAFGLDHDTLERGAKALLEGKGDLGESLFDASVGGGGEVQRLLAELNAEADRIYRPRGTALPLNDALKSFAEAQKSIREKQSLPEAFLAQERALEEAIADRAALLTQKSERVARRARLERLRRRVPLERRHARALAQRAELGLFASEVARVEALKERFVAYERALEQRQKCVADAERLAERVAEAARRAGTTTDALRLDARTEGRIHRFLGERAALTERVELGGAKIAKEERELARLLAAASAHEARPPEGQSALVVALERARALGDIEERIAVNKGKLERRRKELGARAEALGLFAGSLEAFVALRLPAVATIERLEARAEEVARTSARLDERAIDLDKDAALLERQIASSSGDFAPPDAASLAGARSARDGAWKALRTANDGPLRAEQTLEVDRLIRDADAVADRMIRDADRVTTLARLRSEAETNRRQREKLAEDRGRAERDRIAIDAELAELFAAASIAPLGLAEMRQWLGRHAQIVELERDLREADAERALDEAKAASAIADLRAVLGDDGPARLADLIASAAERVAAIETARREAAEIARGIVKIRSELDGEIAKRDHDAVALAATSAKLLDVIGPLGVPADASADEINHAIEARRELFAALDKRADVDARAQVADADVRAFEGDLVRTIAELAPDLSAAPLRDATPTLFARGALAKEIDRELATASAQLAELPPADDDEATVAFDPDEAAREEQEIRDQIDELEGEITRLGERIGGTRLGLEQIRADSHAADAAATAQHELARVRENAERWCRVRIASVVLSREIERYRDENQAPLLASSSSLFSRLTLGAFSGIRAGFDDKDRPALRCVRADGASEVDVTGLSDGTRDQLYLSLRLASLLRRAEVAEPMPLVLDDVLIQLDDQRAGAALAVLAEVARRMQVLFFTHHARLVDLARAAVPASDLVVHELGVAPAADAAVSVSA